MMFYAIEDHKTDGYRYYRLAQTRVGALEIFKSWTKRIELDSPHLEAYSALWREQANALYGAERVRFDDLAGASAGELEQLRRNEEFFHPDKEDEHRN
jgi:hypothetical protein